MWATKPKGVDSVRPAGAGRRTEKKKRFNKKSPVEGKAKPGNNNVGLLGANNEKPMVYDAVPDDANPKTLTIRS